MAKRSPEAKLQKVPIKKRTSIGKSRRTRVKNKHKRRQKGK